MRDEKGQTIFDKFGQPMVKSGEKEFRFSEQFAGPFPLYPKEKLSIPVSHLGYGENKEASLQHRRFEEPFRPEERKVDLLPYQNFEARNLPPKEYVSPSYLGEAPYVQDPKNIIRELPPKEYDYRRPDDFSYMEQRKPDPLDARFQFQTEAKNFPPKEHISPSYMEGGPYMKDQKVIYQDPAAKEYDYRGPEDPYRFEECKPSLKILKFSH